MLPPDRIEIPVAVPCLPRVMPQLKPIATDAELAALDDFQFVLALSSARDRLTVYLRELDAVLIACR